MNGVQIEFDGKAVEYESNRLAAWYKAHAEEVAKHCPQVDSGDILDIGCATGYQLRILAEKNPDANLVGIDLAPKMIEKAMASSASSDQFYFIADDWENLTEENQVVLEKYNFKLIICANVFHYFLNPEQAVQSMYEQLETGGMLLILEREKSNSFFDLILGVFTSILHQRSGGILHRRRYKSNIN